MAQIFGASGGSGAGAILTLFFFAMIFVMIAAQWKVFTKAGQPGWACLIPILNLLVILKLVKRPMWWILLFLIPIVNFVTLLIVLVDLAKAFGKGIGFAIGLIILGPIFYLILGFGSATYQLEPEPIF
ncbi:MAG: hypothetical protein RLY23_1809 [Actinomycetota bacterium]|jgi:hypothetical protein